MFGKKKVPFVEQLQQTECGLCCVSMILKYYGSYQTLASLREYLDVGRDGLTMLQLKRLMNHMGFDSKAFKGKVDGLYGVALPAVIFWTNDHYVVLESLDKNNAVIVDPAFGRRKVTIEVLRENFSGYILQAIPNKDFSPVSKKRSIWKQLFSDIIKDKKLFGRVVLLSLLTYLVTISIPILVQYLIDEVAMKSNEHILGVAFAVITMLTLGFGLMYFLRGKQLINLQVILDKSMMKKTFLHLLEVPYQFFDVRAKGDLLFRINSLHTIRDLLSEQLVKGIIDLGAVLFVFAYLLSQSWLLTLLVTCILIINGIIVFYSRSYIVEANQHEIIDNSKLQSYQVESIYAMFGVKTSGIEDEIYDNWTNRYEKYLSSYSWKERIINIYNTLIGVNQMLSPIIVLFAGIYLYFSSAISLGAAVAVYSMSNMFFGLTISLFNGWNNYLLASSYMERLRDIIDTEIEFKPLEPKEVNLHGDIELRNVSFSYSKHSQEVISNVSLTIGAGEKVAIVGQSGSGKSTLSKLMLGIYMPSEGDIFYDGINLMELDRKMLRKQMSVVPQDIYLFNKSILENIRMNQEEITLDEVKRAAEIAQIADEIEAMPMSYHTIVSEMGMNLSGGQRQRIALARAMIRQPKIMLLDEATSSLDTINEKKVSDYLEAIGATRIVIAHRLSTVMDADRIIVMDQGAVVESGTHDELISSDGLYSRMYSAHKERDILVV